MYIACIGSGPNRARVCKFIGAVRDVGFIGCIGYVALIGSGPNKARVLSGVIGYVDCIDFCV